MFDLEKYHIVKDMMDKELESIVSYLKDKSHPIDQRWEVLMEVEDDLPNLYEEIELKSNRKKFKDIFESNSLCWYTDLHSEQNKTFLFSDVFDMIWGHAHYVKKDDCDIEIDEEMFHPIMETMLQTGCGGCQTDW